MLRLLVQGPCFEEACTKELFFFLISLLGTLAQ